MTTGLMTFHAAHHYGATLQAYALSKAVTDICGHCEVIDYVRPHTLQTNQILQPGLSPKTVLKNAHSLLHLSALKRRYTRFESFINDVIPLGPKRYLTNDELAAQPPAYDRYLCGSDQIWNPRIFSDSQFDPAFFLTFAKEAAAYAPSLGPAKLTGSQRDKLRDLLKHFTHISARESEGASVLSDLTGKTVPSVLDPTLLLQPNDWSALAGEKEKPYLLCYFVSRSDRLAALIPGIKSRLGVSAVQLAGARRKAPGISRVIYDAGPREFLSLFENAACVITNSFHGVSFAIQFRRPFYCDVGGGEDGLASRTGSLLQALGLTRRLIAEGRASDLLDIDYDAVAERLHKERERSLTYLRGAVWGAAAHV